MEYFRRFMGGNLDASEARVDACYRKYMRQHHDPTPSLPPLPTEDDLNPDEQPGGDQWGN